MRREALKLAARAVEQRINADHSDHRDPWLPCEACKHDARYSGRRGKMFVTVLGPMTLERAYYYCDTCGHGFCPRDRALGRVDTWLSPAVTRMVGTAASLVSFQESSELLAELAGLDLNAKQVERTAEALGREIAADERSVIEVSAPTAPTMYFGMDGTSVPMRASELEGRQGKQDDGSAKTREVKLCVTWTAEGRDKDDIPQRDRDSITYSAAIESAAHRDTDEVPPGFRSARRPRSTPPRLRSSQAACRHRRRGQVDLEHRRRTFPRRDSDRRHLPRKTAPL